MLRIRPIERDKHTAQITRGRRCADGLWSKRERWDAEEELAHKSEEQKERAKQKFMCPKQNTRKPNKQACKKISRREETRSRRSNAMQYDAIADTKQIADHAAITRRKRDNSEKQLPDLCKLSRNEKCHWDRMTDKNLDTKHNHHHIESNRSHLCM